MNVTYKKATHQQELTNSGGMKAIQAQSVYKRPPDTNNGTTLYGFTNKTEDDTSINASMYTCVTTSIIIEHFYFYFIEQKSRQTKEISGSLY
ncbi:MAG: hypothetical protein SFH39_00025, partial [Candidatus Magnetobacterium sp. LHC-1]